MPDKLFSEKTGKDIERLVKEILHIENSQKIVLASAHSGNWWNQGYRSNTYRITVDTENEKTRHYFVKEYGRSNACKKDFATETATTYVSNKNKLEIFPQLLSKGDLSFETSRKLFFEKCMHASLEKQFEEIMPTSKDLTKPNGPLTPIINLHEDLPKYEEEIANELNKISKGEHKQLDNLTKEKYADRFVKDVHTLYKGYTDVKELLELEEVFKNEVAGRLLRPNLVTLIQHDGFPKHNLTEVLVDAGAIKYGSRLTHLSCLLGPPFHVFKHHEIKRVLEAYLEGLEDKGNNSITMDELERGFYLSALYTNFAAAAADTNHLFEAKGRKEKKKYKKKIEIYKRNALHSLVVLNHFYNSPGSEKIKSFLYKIKDRK